MGLIKSAADLVYTFRFLKLLVTPFDKTGAYEAGIIDQDGKRIKSFDKNASVDNKLAWADNYTPFHRLVYNIKKLIPLGKLGSYAAALYLIKEKYGVPEHKIISALKEAGVSDIDQLVESNTWFILEDKRLSPGRYKLRSDNVLSESLDDIVYANDWVSVDQHCYPTGTFNGIDVYEVTHVNTKKTVHITSGDIIR